MSDGQTNNNPQEQTSSQAGSNEHVNSTSESNEHGVELFEQVEQHKASEHTQEQAGQETGSDVVEPEPEQAPAPAKEDPQESETIDPSLPAKSSEEKAREIQKIVSKFKDDPSVQAKAIDALASGQSLDDFKNELIESLSETVTKLKKGYKPQAGKAVGKAIKPNTVSKLVDEPTFASRLQTIDNPFERARARNSYLKERSKIAR